MKPLFGAICDFFKRKKGKISRSFEKIAFNVRLNQRTIRMHKSILQDAELALKHFELYESDEAYIKFNDPICSQGHDLRKQALLNFQNCYKESSSCRILIQIPSAEFSPAGYSLFTNIAESFRFIGIPTQSIAWNAETADTLNKFKPTVLLTSDHHEYLNRLDWTAIENYRKKHPFQVGLTASIAEYDNTPLQDRLAWAKKNHINFYYSFRDKEYVFNRIEYQPFFDAHYPMLFLPFGANILHYYPVAGFTRDLDFVLIASRKREHISYLKSIASSYPGFIDGPGWQHINNFQFNRDRDRYIYARAKVGLNIHLPEQLNWACELNERTYQLAACGVPQLIDRPLLLEKLFSKEAFFIANNPNEYFKIFQKLIKDPELGRAAAMTAQKEVFASHTTFHRARHFIDQLNSIELG